MPSNSSSRISILCFVPYYLPGFQSGGPVRSISNLVDNLGDEIDFRIVTSDRDFLASESYPLIDINSWNTVGKAEVFYIAPNILSYFYFLRSLLSSQYDVLYLNTFFDLRFALFPLIFRKLRLAPSRPCVIAPRGQFSTGALVFKSRLKKLYISTCKFFRVLDDLCWQASSPFERSDICRELKSVVNSIKVVPNLLPCSFEHSKRPSSPNSDYLRIIFLSRISPKKNLSFLLSSLFDVSAKVLLSIYGPPEDPEYLSYCNKLISQLPSNIKVHFHGPVLQDNVRGVFAENDLFVFPTLGENFGHVIHESLSVGTPVLLSDATPWAPDPNGGLQVLELNPSLWSAAIDTWASHDHESKLNLQKAALCYYQNNFDGVRSVNLARSLFCELCTDI